MSWKCILSKLIINCLHRTKVLIRLIRDARKSNRHDLLMTTNLIVQLNSDHFILLGKQIVDIQTTNE